MSDERIRLDKWLWFARFYKTRTLAAEQVSGGKVRINGDPVSKPARVIGMGDVLTIRLGKQVRVIRVEATGQRRGPASESCTLYTEILM